MRRYRYPLSAFTLVELLVVIAIIALLAALAIPAIGGAIKRSNASKCMANLKQIGVAYRNYAQDNNNRLIPSTASDRGRNGTLVCPAPPSEPDWRISRIRLSS
jgi:prepilin-type N-terminal cleavage/methylation domain-containing protein